MQANVDKKDKNTKLFLHLKKWLEKAVLDSISFTLNAEEFELFKNSSSEPKIIILGVKLAFTGTKGEFYKIMADDYLHIKQSFLSFIYPVKNDN